MTDIRREDGEPTGRDMTSVDSLTPNDAAEDSRPTDTGIGTRDKGRDADEDARDWDEEEAVRTGEIATQPDQR